ncbi:MAG: NAD(P)/FAD-dependent oxidoreductase [Halieaceae bacterium]|nr:NAD(P)/FAD-dependent oxidoreductase [Halieaceae bacterium]
MNKDRKIAVIGAGMAGLSAAYRLQQNGFSTTLFEENHVVGGRTITAEKDGYTMDLGAITLSPAYKETIQLIEETGAGDACVPFQPVLAIAREGKLHNIDLSSPAVSGIKSGFLSFWGKIKLLKLVPTLVKYWSKCDFEDMSKLEELDVESCESFALRKLGQEINDYLVDPIIRLNMFTLPSLSSVVDIVWLMKMFSGTQLIQLRGGMGAASKSIAAQLEDVQLNTRVTAVEERDGRVALEVDGTTRYFDGAVIALAPDAALGVAPWLSGQQRTWFEKIKAVPSLTIHIGLKSPPDTPASLVMVPSTEANEVIAIVLESNKCPARVPDGKGLISLHMTGQWAETQQGLTDLQVALNALGVISPFMGDLEDQVDMVHLHEWTHVDHERPVGFYKSLRNARPEFTRGRVMFAGTYISAGIEGAVISGKRCAEALSMELKKTDR